MAYMAVLGRLLYAVQMYVATSVGVKWWCLAFPPRWDQNSGVSRPSASFAGSLWMGRGEERGRPENEGEEVEGRIMGGGLQEEEGRRE